MVDDRHEPGTAFDGRWRWLGQPWFLAAVAILWVNDQVLKEQFPSWWTGKLSDLAGVAVVATLLAVLLGPRAGLPLTATGFVALKVVPGVAEVAAPFLGGPTLRDPTDLVALVVLVPMWIGLVEGAPGRAARWASTALPIVGATAAVLAATATSCASDPAVIEVLADDGRMYALTANWEVEWATSTDGVEWSPAASGPPEYGLRSSVRDEEDGYGPSIDPYADPGQVGPQEVCAEDGTCYRLTGDRNIDRRESGGDWRSEFRLSEAEAERAAGQCAGGRRGVMASIALLDTPNDDVVVASLGAGGVLVRDGDGSWSDHSVIGVGAPVIAAEATGAERALAIALTPIWLLTMAGLFLLGRRRGWTALTPALLIMTGGWVLAVAASAIYAGVAGIEVSPIRIGVVIGIVALVGSTVVAVIVAPGRRDQLPSSSG